MSGIGAFTSGFVDAAPTGIALSENYQKGRQRRVDRKAGKMMSELQQAGAAGAEAIPTTPTGEGSSGGTQGAAASSGSSSTTTPAANTTAAPTKTPAPTPDSVMDYRDAADKVGQYYMENVGVEAGFKARQAILEESRANFVSNMTDVASLLDMGDAQGAKKALEWANAYLPNGHGAMVTANKTGLTVQGVDKEGNLFGVPLKFDQNMAVNMIHRAQDPAAYNALTFNRKKLEERVRIADQQDSINKAQLDMMATHKRADLAIKKLDVAAAIAKSLSYLQVTPDDINTDTASLVGKRQTQLRSDANAIDTEGRGEGTQVMGTRRLYGGDLDLGGAVSSVVSQLSAGSNTLPNGGFLQIAENSLLEAFKGDTEVSKEILKRYREDNLKIQVASAPNGNLVIGYLDPNTNGELHKYDTGVKTKLLADKGGTGYAGTPIEALFERVNTILGPSARLPQYEPLNQKEGYGPAIRNQSAGGVPAGASGSGTGTPGTGGISTTGGGDLPPVQTNNAPVDEGIPDADMAPTKQGANPVSPTADPLSQQGTAVPTAPSQNGNGKQGEVIEMLMTELGSTWTQQDAATLRKTIASTRPDLMPILGQMLQQWGIVNQAAPTPPTGTGIPYA